VIGVETGATVSTERLPWYPHSNSPNTLVYGLKPISPVFRYVGLTHFLTFFRCNFHSVPVIENHPITAHVAVPVTKVLVAPARPRHLQSPYRGTGAFSVHERATMNRKYVTGIFGYRIALALLTRSIFQSDEFFQSLEVAHNVVFGYGKLTWEWHPGVAIRSVVYPMLYAPVYWILRVTGLDTTGLLVRESPIIPEPH